MRDNVYLTLVFLLAPLSLASIGGATGIYAPLQHQTVEALGWLTAREMIDGLALAETTPGPLILVTEFVGYFAGLRGMGSVWGGIAGAVVTLWATFAPCFLWMDVVFVG